MATGACPGSSADSLGALFQRTDAQSGTMPLVLCSLFETILCCRYFPTLVVVAIMGQVAAVLPATFTVSLVFLWAFGLAAVCFGFLVASIGRVSTTATLMSVIGWFLFFLPWIVLYLGASGCSSVSKGTQGGMCLLAPSCSEYASFPVPL